jgi:hypothetical protein
MKVVISFILISIISSGCKEKETIKSTPNNTSNKSVAKDIPEWFRDEPEQRWHKMLLDSLNLPTLENGFDSLQVRIFITCSFSKSNLILLTNNGMEGKAVFYSYFYGSNGEGDFVASQVSGELRSPTNGWKLFYDSLIKTGIVELRDQDEFDSGQYAAPHDGGIVLVEIATKKKYRIYEYSSIGMNSKHKGPAILHEALKLIEREFLYKRPCD